MKKVVYYTDTMAFGGAEVYLLRLYSKINKSFFQCRLALQRSQASSKLAQDFQCLGGIVDLIDNEPEVSTVTKVARVFKYFREVKPDVVHINRVGGTRCAHAIWAARLAAIRRIVVTEHFVVPLRERQIALKKIFTKTFWVQRKKIIKKRLSVVGADFVISVSLSNYRQLVKQYHYPRKKTVLIYNGVDIHSK